jgi:hypothetical protein
MKEHRRQADWFVREIKIIVYAGLILAALTGIATQITIAWRVQNKLVSSQDLLSKEFADMKKARTNEALRQQSNAHDMAVVIDSIREAVNKHVSPKAPKLYTPLSERILDIPTYKKMELNTHIGDIPLKGKGE